MEKLKGLDLLAQEAGIQLGFHDNRGVFHRVPDETKMVLLQDMGLITQGVAPESVLADLREQKRNNFLPEVLVLSEEDRVYNIPLVLNRDEVGKELYYYLAADQGESFSGHITEDDLHPTEQLETGDYTQQRLAFSA